MNKFMSYFDAYQPFAESCSAEQPVQNWGDLSSEIEAQAAADPDFEVTELSFAEPDGGSEDGSSEVMQAGEIDGVAMEPGALDHGDYYQGELDTTEFGSVGGDGETFYFLDSDSGASVMI